MKIKRYIGCFIVMIISYLGIKVIIGIFNSQISMTKQHYSKNWNYMVQTRLHTQYKPLKKVEIVMLGDSHMYRVNWNELLSNNAVLNRGIDGDTTAGLLGRLDSILKLKPKNIFLLVGYNDFRKGYEIEEVFSNFKSLIKRIEAKDTVPVVHAILYDVKANYENKIASVNIKLKKYCSKHNILFIDLNQKLSKNNRLEEKYTYDGIHLNVEGYSVWKQEIKKGLDEQKINISRDR